MFDLTKNKKIPPRKLFTKIDLVGPLITKIINCSVCLFLYKAVLLEVISDLTKGTCISTIKPFVVRRGLLQ